MGMRIHCAVCDRSVDKIMRIYDPIRRHTVIRAYCHGEMDQRIITDKEKEATNPNDLRDIETGRIVGTAFDHLWKGTPQ